jgi:hypothetical protein
VLLLNTVIGLELALVFVKRNSKMPAHIVATIERILGIKRRRDRRDTSGQKNREDTA